MENQHFTHPYDPSLSFFGDTQFQQLKCTSDFKLNKHYYINYNIFKTYQSIDCGCTSWSHKKHANCSAQDLKMQFDVKTPNYPF